MLIHLIDTRLLTFFIQVREELVPKDLERTQTPLDEATKFLEPLQLLASKSINTHLLAFEIYLRKGKPLLMLQAIKKIMSLDANSKALHSCFVRFLNYVELNKAEFNPSTIKALETSLPKQLNSTTAVNLNDKFLADNSADLKSLFIGYKLQVFLDQTAAEAAVSKLEATLAQKEPHSLLQARRQSLPCLLQARLLLLPCLLRLSRDQGLYCILIPRSPREVA